jgi:hypothetical protein
VGGEPKPVLMLDISENRPPIAEENARVQQLLMARMAAVAVERNRVFRTPMPDVDGVEEEIEEELARRNEK